MTIKHWKDPNSPAPTAEGQRGRIPQGFKVDMEGWADRNRRMAHQNLDQDGIPYSSSHSMFSESMTLMRDAWKSSTAGHDVHVVRPSADAITNYDAK
jgi:hypothetical protein